MIPSNTHRETVGQALRRASLVQLATGLLTARARRRLADRVRARPRLEGLEDRCMLSISVTEFPVGTPGSDLWGITTGPDGNLWFTEAGSDEVGMINPTTHASINFPIPTPNASPLGITTGPDGNVWFTEGGTYGANTLNKIGMINPTTHAITEFSTPTAASQPYWITTGPDGNIWFTELNADKIGMINPTTHVITEFPVPTANSEPCWITAGPDGNLWFTEFGADHIGMINPTTHVITEFATPSQASTFAITPGPDGNLWFTEYFAGQIGMINPATDAVTEFPGAPYPRDIVAGPDGNLWFTESSPGNIETINPATHVVSEYPTPFVPSAPNGITMGPDDNIWFTDADTYSVGVAALCTTNLVVTAQPPANVTAGSPFGLTVEAEDSSGNVLTSFNGPVTVVLADNPVGATLGGTLTVTASGGMSTFSGLKITRALSGYTIVATSSGLGEGVSNAMTVSPTAATKLVITKQPPSSVQVSSPFSMQALIEDAYGNVVTTASGTVSVAFASNPTGATLGGTTSVTASGGVASFTNLTINKTGSGYTLRVSSSGLTSATSNAIKVTRSASSSTPLETTTSANAADLSLGALVFDSPNVWDGLGFKKRLRSIG